MFQELRSLINKLQLDNTSVILDQSETRYLLKAFWTMACSETENKLKTYIENEAAKYKKEEIGNFRTNFLLRGFYDTDKGITLRKVWEIQMNNSLEFKVNRFTDGFQGLSQDNLEQVLVNFGAVASNDQKLVLKRMYSFYKTRTDIVHTNIEDFSMTKLDLLNELKDLEKAVLIFCELVKV